MRLILRNTTQVYQEKNSQSFHYSRFPIAEISNATNLQNGSQKQKL